MLGIISLALQAAGTIGGIVANERAAARNRRMANRQAADVLALGEQAVSDYRLDAAQLFGQQRTAAAAQGLDVNFGSAKTIREQTEGIVETDIARIRENARREAWGIRTQARLDQQAARAQSLAAGVQLGGTLLAQAPDAWTRYIGGRRRPSAGVPSVAPRTSPNASARLDRYNPMG